MYLWPWQGWHFCVSVYNETQIKHNWEWNQILLLKVKLLAGATREILLGSKASTSGTSWPSTENELIYNSSLFCHWCWVIFTVWIVLKGGHNHHMRNKKQKTFFVSSTSNLSQWHCGNAAGTLITMCNSVAFPQKRKSSFESPLEILVTGPVNEGVDCTIWQGHQDCQLWVKTAPIHCNTNVLHEVKNFNLSPTKDKTICHNKQSFNSVSFGHLQPISLRRVSVWNGTWLRMGDVMLNVPGNW